MGEGDQLTPLGQLLEEARGSMSKRAAAKAAGISEARWRQVVTGVEKARAGVVVPANPKRDTVIAMADAVRVDRATALRAAGMDVDDVATHPAFATFRAEERRRVELLERIATLSQELAAASTELAHLELGDRVRPGPDLRLADMAASQADDESARERFDRVQDEAAEAPDAPGPEHGA